MPEVSVGLGSGYLAVPAESAGPWPGVVVIHEIFGLNRDIRAHADHLASLGYLALAPDLYGGKSWVRCVLSAIRQLHAGTGPAFEALDGFRTWLAERPDCTGTTGVIGFCLGGGFALLCAPRGEYTAAAVNYGEVPPTRSGSWLVPARSWRATAARTRWAWARRSGSPRP